MDLEYVFRVDLRTDSCIHATPGEANQTPGISSEDLGRRTIIALPQPADHVMERVETWHCSSPLARRDPAPSCSILTGPTRRCNWLVDMALSSSRPGLARRSRRSLSDLLAECAARPQPSDELVASFPAFFVSGFRTLFAFAL
jgi:hypothetical protein